MPDTAVTAPPPIALRELWPWAAFAFVLLALVYLVGAEEGATALIQGTTIHELMHDGRHVLAFPCH